MGGLARTIGKPLSTHSVSCLGPSPQPLPIRGKRAGVRAHHRPKCASHRERWSTRTPSHGRPLLRTLTPETILLTWILSRTAKRCLHLRRRHPLGALGRSTMCGEPDATNGEIGAEHRVVR